MRRSGRTRRDWLVGVAVVLSMLWPGMAQAGKRHDADRFDVQIQLRDDGTTQVTETVVFRFAGGTFTYVRRELPLGRTDGIEVVAAGMDATALRPGGEGETRLETSRRDNRLRVVWRFPATQGLHTFSLTYVVAGLVEARGTEDVLAWAALPRDHDYRIGRSRVTLEWPQAARVLSVAAGGRPVERTDNAASLELQNLGRNESVTVRATFEAGSAAPRRPEWQERAVRRREAAPSWATLAAMLLVVVSGFFWVAWARSPRPSGTEAFDTDEPRPPSEIPPALAGALASRGGGPSTAHLVGAVIDMARRGLLRIEERPPARWGSRTFVVHREEAGKARQPLRPHEHVLLERLFTRKGRLENEVEMRSVPGRLASASRDVTRSVRQELTAAGLLDPDRLGSRRRMMTAAALVLAAAIVAAALAIPFADMYAGWPFLAALALGASSVVGFVLAASLHAQTDQGVRQGERWRRFAAHLHRAGRKNSAATGLSADVLAYATAFGAASGYVKALQRLGAPLPAWFHAASAATDQQHAAFVALMATTAASGSSSTTAGGGGGAAGGGSSSAG